MNVVPGRNSGREVIRHCFCKFRRRGGNHSVNVVYPGEKYEKTDVSNWIADWNGVWDFGGSIVAMCCRDIAEGLSDGDEGAWSGDP